MADFADILEALKSSSVPRGTPAGFPRIDPATQAARDTEAVNLIAQEYLRIPEKMAQLDADIARAKAVGGMEYKGMLRAKELAGTQPRAASPAALSANNDFSDILAELSKPQAKQGALSGLADLALAPVKAVGGFARDVLAGQVRGAASIGGTLVDANKAVYGPILRAAGVDVDPVTRASMAARLGSVNDFLRDAVGADTSSVPFVVGKMGAEIAGTAGVGGALAQPFVRSAPAVSAALQSGGFAGGLPLAGRMATGAVVGGASAGLIDPSQAGAGAIVGGALPGAVKLAGMAGQALSGKVSPEVAQLYDRAKQLGIEVPADRIANSKPMNALAASLNYVPFSGRAATEEAMASQVNRALSRTFGQDTPNITKGLRDARKVLGSEFDNVLTKNTVGVDNKFLSDLATTEAKAAAELGKSEFSIIKNQIDEILSRGGAGQIEGQTAYNIKKTLDRIGQRQTNEAYYARQLQKDLMGALERSLGPNQASQFSALRRQYGNMLELEGLAARGADGGITIGRLSGMRGQLPKEIEEIADIASQFVKTRESPHGALQRLIIGGATLGTAGASGVLPAAGIGLTAGRGMNMLLNSNMARNAVANQSGTGQSINNLLANPALRNALYASPSAISP